MKTPIADFLDEYSRSEVSRLHMPGHKGKFHTGPEKYDITEVSGADVLYSAEGIIKESRENASSLFAADTFYSAEGSTLAIKAMLKLATDKYRNPGERPLVLAGRNAHKSFISAAALLDFDVLWIYPDIPSHIASCNITAESVSTAISKETRRISAVYITSPDYLGGISDVKGIADACKANGIPLLVDNAHGAYLAFLEPSLHPIALGAAMCADSAHKTLPVLTGGAYLHVSKDYSLYSERAEGALSLFASTSPSYLILRSLDICNAYLSSGYKVNLAECVNKINLLKAALRKADVAILDTEPLKITLSAKKMGYTGKEIADILRTNSIECEFADRDYTVMMITPDNSDDDFEKIYSVLSSINKREPIREIPPPMQECIRAKSVREAVFSLSERIDTELSQGRICASASVACPPAIPIAVAGEVITEDVIKLLNYYKIDKIDVVK